jgi:RNA polymerase sigma-70 factor (ECF subfamily)
VFLEGIVQEACMKVLEKLQGFEGRSRFRTWAVTIAVRTAISKMRKREWQNVSLESLTFDAKFDPQMALDSAETVDRADSKVEILTKLKELIDGDLTDRQWTALTAELSGMPLPQIAERFGSNTNSVYKLLHDARKKLRHGLEAAGITVDDIRAEAPKEPGHVQQSFRRPQFASACTIAINDFVHSRNEPEKSSIDVLSPDFNSKQLIASTVHRVRSYCAPVCSRNSF